MNGPQKYVLRMIAICIAVLMPVMAFASLGAAKNPKPTGCTGSGCVQGNSLVKGSGR